MQLWIEVNEKTKKKNWNAAKCDACKYRYSCFTGNEIIIESDTCFKHDNSVGFLPPAFQAKFSIPSCIRIGLFKQLSDTWFNSNFKYGRLRDNVRSIHRVVVTIKPPTIVMEGWA